MLSKEQQLQAMLHNDDLKDFSDNDDKQHPSRSQYRKPISHPFSDHSSQLESDSDNEVTNNLPPFPPKQPKPKSILQSAQSTIKWNNNQQVEIDLLIKLEGQGVKDKKIRQLATKLKTLNLQYEKQKTIRKGLENQLNNQLNQSLEKTKSIEKLNKQDNKQDNKSKIDISKCNHCKQLQKKNMEFRLKAQNLQTQLNKALRIIKMEIGDNFNIDEVLNDQSSWKGRQQKIDKLKFKVKELEEKLVNNGVNVSHMSGFTQNTNNNNSNNNNKTSAQFSASSQRSSTMIAQNKRKQLDNLKVQVDALKTQNQLLQGKVKSLTSRKLILENEMKELKADYQKKKQIFAQKSQNDDKFIGLLKNQNEKLKKNQKVVTKVIYNNNQQQIISLKKQIEKLQRKVSENSKNLNNLPSYTQLQKNPKISVRELSAEKKQQLEQQYLKSNKYLKKLNAQQQQEIYKKWKESKNIQN